MSDTQLATAIPESSKQLTLGINFKEDAHAGFEGMTKDHIAIPLLKILQSLSPEVKEDRPEYVFGAKPGMFFNSITKEIYPSIKVIPCAFKQVWNRWVDRNAGGGFKGTYAPSDPIVLNSPLDEKGRRIVKEDNTILVDTRNHFVLAIHPITGAVMPMVLALASTQIKKSKDWNAQSALLKLKDENGMEFQPPLYAAQYELSTITETKANNSWKSIVIKFAGLIEDPHAYNEAKRYYELVQKGGVDIDMENAADDFRSDENVIEGEVVPKKPKF